MTLMKARPALGVKQITLVTSAPLPITAMATPSKSVKGWSEAMLLRYWVESWLEEVLGGVAAVHKGIAEVPARKAGVVISPTGSAIGSFLRVDVDGVVVLTKLRASSVASEEPTERGE